MSPSRVVLRVAPTRLILVERDNLGATVVEGLAVSLTAFRRVSRHPEYRRFRSAPVVVLRGPRAAAVADFYGLPLDQVYDCPLP